MNETNHAIDVIFVQIAWVITYQPLYVFDTHVEFGIRNFEHVLGCIVNEETKGNGDFITIWQSWMKMDVKDKNTRKKAFSISFDEISWTDLFEWKILFKCPFLFGFYFQSFWYHCWRYTLTCLNFKVHRMVYNDKSIEVY